MAELYNAPKIYDDLLVTYDGDLLAIQRSAAGFGEGASIAIRQTGPFFFEPPIQDSFPWAKYQETSIDHQLFGYVRQGGRARNLYYLVNGTFTDVDPLDSTVVNKVYLGGHVYEISEDEVAILTAAGFGANIVEK